MLKLPFLLQPINCTGNNETIPLPSQLDAGSQSVSPQEPTSTGDLFPELLPHEWGRARKALGFLLGTVSAHQNDHTMALSTCKRRKPASPSTKPHQEPSWKRPCSQICCVRTKRFRCSSSSKGKPLFAAHSNGKTNSFALTNLFALAESGH